MFFDVLKFGYNFVAEYSSEIVDVFDRDSLTCIYASPANKKILGFEPEELIGQHCLELVHPEDREFVQELLQEGLTKGTGSAEYRLRKKDGSYFWVEAWGYLIKQAGQTDYIIIITRDIHERKLAETALQLSEKRYRLISENARDLICVIDANDFKYLYTSPSYSLLGYAEEELSGQSCFNLIHQGDRSLAFTKLAEWIKKGWGSYKYRVLKNNGSFIWFESVGRLFESPDSSEIIIISRDISESKRVIEQYNFLNTVFDNMNEFCYTYDKNYNITFVNKKITEGTGYSREEMIGRCIWDLVHPDDREMVRSFARQRLQNIDIDRYEHRLLCKNGQELLVHIKGSPLVNNGKITGAVIVCDDITEYKKLQSEMTRLDQMHTLGEIAAGIAHEIRNPMTTVNGFLQLLAKDEDFIEKREYLEIMIEELNRANGIIGEFLNLARNKIVDLEACQINQIIRSLAPLLQADAFLSDRTIILKLGDVPDLLLDVKEIRQLIINLVRNALEATPREGMVEIITQHENNAVLLSVRDQGKGIPDEMIEKLGTPFFSTKDDGTGLGLAICYGIIERHKAKLDIDSSPSGTTFTVKFNCQSQLT